MTENRFAHIDDDIARAKAAQERRRAAPEVYAADASGVPRKNLIKLHCPDSVPKDGKPPKTHGAFFDPRDYEKLVSNGYMAVRDAGGRVVEDSGDVLMEIPHDIWHAGQVAIGRASSKRLETPSEEVEDNAKEQDGQFRGKLTEKTVVRRRGTREFQQTLERGAADDGG